MTIEQAVLQKLRTLPEDKQRQLLRFIESLQPSPDLSGSRARLKGLWSDLSIDLTEEDIRAARREMWSGFPRDGAL